VVVTTQESTCSCLRAVPDRQFVAPRVTAAIAVRLDPAGQAGDVQRRLRLFLAREDATDESRQLDLFVSAQVTPRVRVTPSAVDLGKHDAAAFPSQEIAISSSDARDLEGFRWTVDDPRLKVTWRRIDGQHGAAKIELFSPQFGRIDSLLRLFASGLPPKGLPVQVTGEIVSPWTPSDATVFFGFQEIGSPVETRTIRLAGLPAASVKLARSDEQGVRVSATAAPDAPGDAQVSVVLDPGAAAAGPLDGSVIVEAVDGQALWLPLVGEIRDPNDCGCK